MQRWGKNINNNRIPLVGQSRKSRISNGQTLFPPPNIILEPNQLSITHNQTDMKKDQRIKLDNLSPRQRHAWGYTTRAILPIWIHPIFVVNNGLPKTATIIEEPLQPFPKQCQIPLI